MDIPESVELKLPATDDNTRNVFAYLIKTRGITKDIVTELIKRKMIYQDKHKNCVFVGYDINDKNKPVYACLRGTNTYKKFQGDVRGCDYSKGIYVENGSKTFVVTESFIDAMSVMTIMGKDWKKHNYLALGGTGKYEAIKSYLNAGKVKNLIIATDNDKAGRTAAKIISTFVKRDYPDVSVKVSLPPVNSGKDWNEVINKNKK